MTELEKKYSGSLYGSLVGSHRMPTFTGVWDSAEKFLEDYFGIGIPATITNETATTLYYLLYSRYGNSTIASSDVTRFKYKVFALIFQYAPTWEKKLDIQKTLRELSVTELLTGSRQIYNNASNPNIEPSTDEEQILKYINQQNVTHNKRGTLEGYGLLWDLLRDDVTEKFITKFKNLFITFVDPEDELVYISEE